MKQNVKGTIVVIIYLITTSLGGLTIIDSALNEYQIFAGVAFISFWFFILTDKSNLKFCYKALINCPSLSIRFGTYLVLMFMPIYITQKHGVTYVFYCLSFSIVMSLLGFFNTKKYIVASFFLLCLFYLLFYYHFELYHIIAILGPLSAYYVLKSSRNIALHFGANTNNLMTLRYLVLSMISLLALPFLNFHISLFTTGEVSRIVLIAFFCNIVPIYCSQYVTILIDNNFFAKGAAFLPLSVYITNLIYHSNEVNNLELLASVVITLPIIYSLITLVPQQKNRTSDAP